jgi:hypothetical protein
MLLLYGVRQAAALGFRVGIVSNGYWATDEEAATLWLSPFEGLVADLSLSNDLYHHREAVSQQVEYAVTAANKLKIPIGTISIAQPEDATEGALGKLPEGLSGVMYRGRAARELAPRTVWHFWDTFNECPYENLRAPGRVHVDPLGNLHICQGISLGNMFQTPLKTLCEDYDPDTHPIIGPLLAGGPARLVEAYDLPHEGAYADACHLCDAARRQLRSRFPEILRPEQMYGVAEG